MNKAKAVFWLIVIGFLLLVFFQNQNFFFAKQSLHINLLFVKYQTPEVAAALLFLALFVLGLLVSYFLCLPERFRLRKTIKNLNATVDSQNREIADIKKDLAPVTTESVNSQKADENISR
jgi:uncharacterized integral membrane protein